MPASPEPWRRRCCALACALRPSHPLFPFCLLSLSFCPACGFLAAAVLACLVGRSAELMCPMAGCCCCPWPLHGGLAACCILASVSFPLLCRQRPLRSPSSGGCLVAVLCVRPLDASIQACRRCHICMPSRLTRLQLWCVHSLYTPATCSGAVCVSPSVSHTPVLLLSLYSPTMSTRQV